MNKIKKILLVEDDRNLGELLTDFLTTKDFNVTLAQDGEEGSNFFLSDHYDFIILDVMMPKKDGFTLAKEIRKKDSGIPILFLTAKSMEEDKLQGFNVGGDDYLTKPFSMDELVARITAIGRRIKAKEVLTGVQNVGKYLYNPHKQTLTIHSISKKLTTKENELLKLLVINKNNVLDRNEALKKVWGNDSYFNGRSMDVYITKLRKHLKEDSNIEIINAHGIGFRLQIND